MNSRCLAALLAFALQLPYIGPQSSNAASITASIIAAVFAILAISSYKDDDERGGK